MSVSGRLGDVFFYHENNQGTGIVVTNLHTKSEQNYIHVTDRVFIINMYYGLIVFFLKYFAGCLPEKLF